MTATDFEAPVNPRQLLLVVAIVLAVFLVMVVAVFATESTFGQRCAESYTPDSADWNACVTELVGGRSYW